MEAGICYLFGAGEHYGDPPVPARGDLVIAVDGGLAYLREKGRRADLVVGDFDSLDELPPLDSASTLVLPQEKDDTDMRAALRQGLDRGYRLFHIYGGTGGRLDHTLANLQCLAYLAQKGARGLLFDRETVITVLRNGSLRFPAGAEGTLSALAFSEEARGVWERGFKYSLTNAVLRSTAPLGISNEFTGAEALLTVAEGALIAIYPRSVRDVTFEAH